MRLPKVLDQMFTIVAADDRLARGDGRVSQQDAASQLFSLESPPEMDLVGVYGFLNENVYVFEGGMDEWKAAGLPVVKGENRG